MDTKKILIIVVLLIASVGGYMFFTKTKKTDVVIDGQAGKDNGDGTVTLTRNDGTTITVKKPESEEVQAALAENLKNSLSASEKATMAGLASAIYEDMKGWNDHEMRHYKNLYEVGDAAFLYFVEVAYPSFDKNKSFRDRLRLQNFQKVNSGSKKVGLEKAKAEELIAFIVNRMDEFKF